MMSNADWLRGEAERGFHCRAEEGTFGDGEALSLALALSLSLCLSLSLSLYQMLVKDMDHNPASGG